MNSPLSPELGKLYNWYAVASGNLCPAGWHIPTRLDWDTLINHLGGSLEAGGKMKSLSTLWQAPNTGASNSSDFTALPAGYRSSNNSFWDIYKTTIFGRQPNLPIRWKRGM